MTAKLVLQYCVASAVFFLGLWMGFEEWSVLVPRLVAGAGWVTHSTANLFFLPCLPFWLMLTAGMVQKMKLGGTPRSTSTSRLVRVMFLTGLVATVIAFFGPAILRVGLGAGGYTECPELAHGGIFIEHRYYARRPEICSEIDPHAPGVG